MEIADERRVAAGVEHARFDFGHGRGGFRHVHGDAHHLRAGVGQLDALLRGGGDVGGVGIGHGLDDDGRAAADRYWPTFTPCVLRRVMGKICIRIPSKDSLS